ncbi:MAG: DUF4386 family protein [Kordiimonadaceae bacterium]|nr:DUF4386 family protein [Kordiimonadaceae bacterium]MBO6570057.1 DUF4386 family protein [Kordiimonadaceae bacterium]MBO6965846.1 DUF4386 family protein [Kordiimonadaceae bacterium]
MNLQKFGGLAALFEAAAYIFGFWLFLGYLDPTGYEKKVAFLAETQTAQYIGNIVIYTLFGVFLVVLALALHERLKTGAEALMQTATVFGFIWAGLVIATGMIAVVGADAVVALNATDPTGAASLLQSISTIQEGLGGGVEVVGGIWLLLLSIAGLRGLRLPKPLNYLGILVGAAGTLTIIPPISEVGAAIFGLGQIVWFLWVGIALLRGK